MLIARTLDDAIDKAWDHWRKWVHVIRLSDGVQAVMCSPRTRKDGINYWIWCYRTTEGPVIFRARKRPLK